MTLGGAAHEAVKGLSGSPILLIVAVLNVLMLGALIYVAQAQVEERHEIATQGHEMVKALLDKCGPQR
jgi:hypothetical protein